ncbi:DUF1858 domain-containing protein [Aquifex sp.]
MAVMKLTEDIVLKDLFEVLPQAKEILSQYGYNKLVQDKTDQLLDHRLTLKGFMNLMNLSEEKREELWNKIQQEYNKKLAGG